MDDVGATGPVRQPGMLQRIFPMPPPLPGKPDPLAGFSYGGPLGGAVRALYLLSRRPVVWIGLGITWAACYLLTLLLGNSILGSVASIGTFASTIAAGWIGWQRPWAFGAATAFLGYVLYVIVLTILTIQANIAISPGQAIVASAFTAFFFGVVGALAGFYGGYLRRRLAQPGGRAASSRRR